jgi:hypothetical protein
MMNFLKNVKITLVNDAAASAGTAVNSSSVDMAGFDGVVFVGKMATVNATNSAHVATSSDDSAFNDLLGTSVVPGDDADSWAIEVHKPLERYLRCEVVRSGANTALGEIYAFQYTARKAAVTQGTTIDSEVHASPAEGTA